jgi:predicted lactoylglutathione lyase
MNYDVFTPRQQDEIKKMSLMFGEEGAVFVQLLNTYEFWQKKIKKQILEKRENKTDIIFYAIVCREYIDLMIEKDPRGHKQIKAIHDDCNGLERRITDLEKEFITSLIGISAKGMKYAMEEFGKK